MLGLFGSFKAFTLEDNVLSIFSYDPFCQVYYNFRINSLSASTCWPDQGMAVQYDSFNIHLARQARKYVANSLPS